MLDRIYQMTKKELLQILRYPVMLSIILIVPILECLVIGSAISLDVTNVDIAFLDQDESEISRRLIEQFILTKDYHIVEVAKERESLLKLLLNDQALITIEIPHGFGSAIEEGRLATAQILINGVNANTAAILKSQLTRMEKYLARTFGKNNLDDPKPKPIRLEHRIWFNESLRSDDYLVPLLSGAFLSIIILILSCMSIVREKEMGTLEQLLVSPMSEIELILGKGLLFFLIGLCNLLIETPLCLFWFHIPFRGSFVTYFFVSSIYILVILATGFFLSMRCQTQKQAIMSSFLLYFPMIFFSGFAFPVENMPTLSRWFATINPMRHFFDIVHLIFLKGVGFEVFWPETMFLSLLAFIIFWMVIYALHQKRA